MFHHKTTLFSKMVINFWLISRFAWIIFVAFGSCWHLSDIIKEYLSYPVVIDVVLEDPHRQQIPHLSICFDLKNYLHPHKTLLLWYKLKKQLDNFTFNDHEAAINCFQKSEEYGFIQSYLPRKGKTANWTINH